VAVVESASLPEAAWRYGTLHELPSLAGTASAPALLLLGEVYAEAAAEALARCTAMLKTSTA
jgi:siroheme synthase